MNSRIVVLSFLAFFPAWMPAQDPTFRAPESRRPSSQQSAPVATGGDVLKSAGLINNMEMLDNTNTIRSGDIISLRIVEDRKEPIQLRVGVTGEINAPHIGLVRAAGRTCRELGYQMKSQLEKTLYNRATVIVAIDQRPEDVGGRGPSWRTGVNEMDVYTVFGQVIQQGRYELPDTEDTTISQAILKAGGFAQFANPKKVKLVRKTPQGNKTIVINVDQIMRKGNLERDVFLRRGDVIIVDEKTVNF